MNEARIVYVLVDKDTGEMQGGEERAVFSSRSAARHEVELQGDPALRVRRAKLTIFGS